MGGSKFTFPWITISVLAKAMTGSPLRRNIVSPDSYRQNQAQVKDGWCWWHRKYAPEHTVLVRGWFEFAESLGV